MKGKIVLIPFPFTDLTAAKLRPALVLFEGERDVVAAFISSRLPEGNSLESVLIRDEHQEFQLTGLKVSSVVRLDKVATVLKDLVVGEIGEVGEALKREITENSMKSTTCSVDESLNHVIHVFRGKKPTETFPEHFHYGSEDNVTESYVSDDPREAMREFLNFRSKLEANGSA